jgi:hypothetical protein
LVDLIKYLPDYYENVKETNALMEAENPEFDLQWESVYQVRRNQFILEADERRIRRWEKLLRLRPDYRTQGLDHRKAVVIMRLGNRDKLTYRWLLSKVNDVFGSDNNSVDLRHNEYMLWVRIYDDPMDLSYDFLLYLRKTIPANLGITFGRMWNHNVYIGLINRIQEEYKGRPNALSGQNTQKIYVGLRAVRYEHFKAKY